MNTALELKGVVKTYGSRRALDGLSTGGFTSIGPSDRPCNRTGFRLRTTASIGVPTSMGVEKRRRYRPGSSHVGKGSAVVHDSARPGGSSGGIGRSKAASAGPG